MSDVNESKAARVHVGCQGWNYDDWVTPALGRRAVFYPRGTRADRMLDVYARAFDTVEVDSTFYAIPTDSAVDGWRRRAPLDFTFALKLPREITHDHGLQRARAERGRARRACARRVLPRRAPTGRQARGRPHSTAAAVRGHAREPPRALGVPPATARRHALRSRVPR